MTHPQTAALTALLERVVSDMADAFDEQPDFVFWSAIRDLSGRHFYLTRSVPSADVPPCVDRTGLRCLNPTN